MRYHLEIGKRQKEFIISFIIAKDYFSFPAFTNVNYEENKGSQWKKKTTLTASLLLSLK